MVFFSFKKDFCFKIMCRCVSVQAYVHMSIVSSEAGSSEQAGVIGSYELPNVGAGHLGPLPEQ